MRNLIYGAFTTLIMFGLGKCIYDAGYRKCIQDSKRTIEIYQAGVECEKSKKESK